MFSSTRGSGLASFNWRLLLQTVALAVQCTLASSEELSRGAALDRLFGVQRLHDPAISPDGQWVAYGRERDIWRVATKGGEPQHLAASKVNLSDLAWSPTGIWLTYLANDEEGRTQVWALPAGMGAVRQFTTLPAGDAEEYAWSPGGDRIAVVINEPTESLVVPGQANTYQGSRISLEYKDADLRDVLLKFTEITELSFMLDADVSGRVTMRIVEMPWDEALERLLKAHGLGYVIDDTVVRIGRLSTLALEPSPTPTPSPLVVRGLHFIGEGKPRRTRVAVVEVPSGRERTLDVGGMEVADLAWSPDGTKLAFAGARPHDPPSTLPSNFDLYVMPVDEPSPPRVLVTDLGDQNFPAFSPDGKDLAYRTEHDPSVFPYSQFDLGLVRLVDGARRRLGPVIDREVSRPIFSADGKAVLFLLEDAGCVHIARIDLLTERLGRVMGGERTIEAFSQARDGRLVVLEGDSQRAADLAMIEQGEARLLISANTELVGLALGKVERWRVQSADGSPVDGFIVHPPTTGTVRRPGPGILWLHGGPASQATASLDRDWQALALAGYTVIAPNPRGSSGYGTAYSAAIKGAWGTHDFDDGMAALDAAIAAGIVDPARIGVGGASYGGWLTNHILTRTSRFRAAVSLSGISNVFALLGVNDTQTRLEAELGLPWANRDAWLRHSPWFDAPRVKTPTLILCGELDRRTPLEQSELWYYALRRLGVETELVIYPGEGHGPRNQGTEKDRLLRILAWFDRFLSEEPAQGAR